MIDLNPNKVVIGMSGGVDSSVAAHILKEQGYDVVGVTMQIWNDDSQEEREDNGGCCGLSAVDDARRVANILDIPYYVLNFRNQFAENVIDYFATEYQKGNTPNPCIACNRYVKWESLLDRSMELGANFIATGHYAHVVKHPVTNRFTLEISKATGKDQTYALYNLTQFQLEHTIMPLWNLEKTKVREIAESLGLCVANKPDSQEICFIPDNDYGKFLTEYTDVKVETGNYIDESGNILGKHDGIIYYTVGQRKGLGMTFGKPMYVKEINPTTRNIILTDNSGLFQKTLYADNLNFMAIETITEPIECLAKIRYSQNMEKCTIKLIGDRIFCEFENPQRAPTPGQAAVFYKDNYVLCGGTICRE